MLHKGRHGFILPALAAVAFIVLFTSYGSDAASDQLPVLDNIPSQQVDELSELTFMATATDPDDPNGDNMSFLLAGDSPAGAVINGTTGVFSWTPTEYQDGIHVVNVTVRDGSGGADSQVVEITVNETNSLPVLGAIWDILTFELLPLNFTVPVTDTDDPPDTLVFSAAGLPDGASIDPTSGAFSWTPAEDQDGLHRFNLTVSDGRGGSDLQTVSVGVLEVNAPPAFDAAPNHIVSDLSPLNLNLTASDPDLPANTLTYSLIDSPEGAHINPNTGNFSWTPVMADGQIDSILVLVDDGEGGSDFLAIEIEAEYGGVEIRAQSSNQPPDLDPIRPFHHHVDECSTVKFSTTASDPDKDALTFSWGNKPESVGDTEHSFTSTRGTPADTYRGDFSWTTEAVHVGSNGVQVVVSDGTLSDSRYTYVNVWKVLPTFSNKPTSTLQAHVGQEFAYQAQATDDCEDEGITYSLYDPTPATANRQVGMGVILQHYIDEYNPPDHSSINSATGKFTWTPTSDQAGLHHVVIAAHDADGRFGHLRFHVDVNTPPTVHHISAKDVDEGDVLILYGRATDANGDDLTYSWTYDPSGPITLNNHNIHDPTLTAHQVSSDTDVTVELTVTDEHDASSSISFTVTVTNTNDPPTASIDSLSIDTINPINLHVSDSYHLAMRPGYTATLHGTGSDPDGNSISYSWAVTSEEGHTVDLRNEKTSSVTFVAPNMTDVLTFKLTVSDRLGSHATASVPVYVNTPPELSITAPEGAFVRYTGLFITLIEDRETVIKDASYTLQGTDADGGDVNILVAQEPPLENAVLADCKTLYLDYEDYKLYREDPGDTQPPKNLIYTGPEGGLSSVCIVALGLTDDPLTEDYDSSEFVLSVNDGVYEETETVQYTIITPIADFAVSLLDAASNLFNLVLGGQPYDVMTKFKGVQTDLGITQEILNAGKQVYVEFFRCAQDLEPTTDYCNLYDGLQQLLQDDDTLSHSGATSIQYQSGTDTSEWTVIARSATNGTETDPYVALIVNNRDEIVAAAPRPTNSTEDLAANLTAPLYMQLYDYSVQPNKTYSYAVRLIINGTTSDYIPLGNITMPADTTPPVIELSGSANMTVPRGTTYSEPGYYAVDDYDNDLTGNVVITGAVDASTVGTYYLYYDVADSSGNAAITQNRTVTVMDQDLAPPILTLKGQQTMTVEGGTTYVDPGYTAFDNMDGNITDMVVVTGTVDITVLGTYIIHYDISDSSGNAAITQNRTVTVVDTTPPVFTLKGEVDMTIPASVPYVEPGYTSIDSMDGNVTHRVAVLGAVDVDAQASYRMAYFAGDNSGNLAPTLYRNVIVADMTPPALTLKGDAKIWVTKGMIYTEPGYTAIDNIDGNVTSRVVVTGTMDVNMEGTYTLSYDITDRAGNAATTQNRTVTVVAGDATPIITLKGQQVMTIEEGMVYVEPGYTATDREDGDLTGNVTVSGTVNATKTGTYTLHYDVTDSSGNRAVQQVRTIQVVDVTAPTITLTGSTDMTVQANSAYVDPGYAATDDYDGDLTASVVVTGMVDVTHIGTYTLHYDVSDNSGNRAVQQSRTVHVVDATSPTITLTDPTDMTIQINSTYVDPGYMAADNYDGDLTASVIITGTVDVTQIGTYHLYYDVSDSSGNAATQQTRTIRVVAATPPTITLSGSSTTTVSFGSAYSEPGYMASDPEDGDLTASVTVTGTVDTAKIGTYTLYYDVSDRFDNKAVQQTRTVRVVDVTPPTITLAGQTTMTIPVNTTYADPGYTATDNHDGDLTASVIVTGTVNTTKIGTYTIYYNVVDSFGNNAVQQIRTVHVADIPDPQAGLPEVVKRYDTNRNGVIDQPEWQRAINDYTSGLLTIGELYTISAARSYG